MSEEASMNRAKISLLAAAASILFSVSANAAPLVGNPAQGKTIFARCAICHSLQAGVNEIGPSLHGVVGRHSGSVPGYSYSSANIHSGLVWTPANLDRYLKSPQTVVPGTKMAFAGLPKDQDRADVIAYLAQNK
jgi:cytochrome c